VDKKRMQLGMNPSTASGRLVKDVLFKLIETTGGNVCFQCGEPMTRDTFSIEHKEPWLDSDDPVGVYFDLNNIAFSHHSCNSSAGRKAETPHGSAWRYDKYKCRCDICVTANRTRVYNWRKVGIRKS